MRPTPTSSSVVAPAVVRAGLAGRCAEPEPDVEVVYEAEPPGRSLSRCLRLPRPIHGSMGLTSGLGSAPSLRHGLGGVAARLSRAGDFSSLAICRPQLTLRRQLRPRGGALVSLKCPGSDCAPAGCGVTACGVTACGVTACGVTACGASGCSVPGCSVPTGGVSACGVLAGSLLGKRSGDE